MIWDIYPLRKLLKNEELPKGVFKFYVLKGVILSNKDRFILGYPKGCGKAIRYAFVYWSICRVKKEKISIE